MTLVGSSWFTELRPHILRKMLALQLEIIVLKDLLAGLLSKAWLVVLPSTAWPVKSERGLISDRKSVV